MIRLEKISKKRANSSVQVLDNLVARFKEGHISVILGASGMGKSTLLNCILQTEACDSGSIIVNGETLCSDSVSPALMSGVLQSPALFQHLTVLDNMILAPRLVLKQTREQATEAAMQKLALLGVDNKANVYPHQLSGGECQRVSIARAMMMQSKVLILDEPTNALNESWILELAQLLNQLAAEGTTIVLSTHNLLFAQQLNAEMFLLQNGKLSPLEAFEVQSLLLNNPDMMEKDLMHV